MKIGLVIILVILVPVLTIIATFIIENRRKPRISALFIGSLVLQVSAIAASFVVLSLVMGLFVP